MVRLVSVLALAVTSAAGLAAASPTTRTVYVTVVGREGQAVPGLTPADFGLKEGGKECEESSRSSRLRRRCASRSCSTRP